MMRWRPMASSDLGAVHALADAIHRDHPEDPAVLAERQRLFPDGCQVLDRDGAMVGYVISHPWKFGQPPALNTLLEGLPVPPTTYYLHDLAIAPAARGTGSAGPAVERLSRLAEDMGFANLSLVAVNASRKFWEKFGFGPIDLPGMASKLSSYGDDAVFMARELGKRAQAQ
jgi:GNAT superfamily N-acetyltransferase